MLRKLIAKGTWAIKVWFSQRIGFASAVIYKCAVELKGPGRLGVWIELGSDLIR